MADGNQQTDDSQLAKQRLRQVFQFLKELNQHRYPPKREINDQKWCLSLSNLPEHPAIHLGRRTAAVLPTNEDSDTVRSTGNDDALGFGAKPLVGHWSLDIHVRRVSNTTLPMDISKLIVHVLHEPCLLARTRT